VTASDWATMNQNYLHTQLQRLRLLLHRRILWLRKQWKHDPLQSYQGLMISETRADGLLSGEDPTAEKRFYQKDPEAARLSSEIEAIQKDLGALRAVDAGGLPALDVLAKVFHLTLFDQDVLLLCLAPELDPAFERLYAYVQDDATRKYPTFHLAWTLCIDQDVTRETAYSSFLPGAPLRRFGLISFEYTNTTHRSVEPIRLNRRIADYLLGLNRMDDQVTHILRPVETAHSLSSEQEEMVGRLEHLLRTWNNHGKVPAINLIGLSGVGRRIVARTVCNRLGMGFYNLEITRLSATGREREELRRILEREATLLPTAYYIDLSETDSGNRTELIAHRDIIEDLHALLFIGSRELVYFEREITVVRVPKADASAQHKIWKSALSGEIFSSNGGSEVFLQTLVQQFDFGPQRIHKAAEMAKGLARLRDTETLQLTTEDIWTACRTLAAQPLEGLAQKLTPSYTWEDIVLPEDVFKQLKEIAAQVAHRTMVYDTWGFGAKLSRGRGIAALFSGPSGTGKTMAAEILANHLQLDLYRIDLSGVVSKYIGETEKNLRKVFDAAEQSGAILFFDEADALFGKRSEVKDSHDRYANIEINYLLQRMEDYRGLAILATNMKSLLDQAFLRRLRFLVDFPLPDAAQRLRIWQKVFPPEALVDGLDYASLSRLEIAGGNIKNISLNAAFLAASAGLPISMTHIMRAARREYTKIDKLMLESEFGHYYAMVKG
jgi:SpoVK/Ycf46/Vps4 family AAA+-type ATPase